MHSGIYYYLLQLLDDYGISSSVISIHLFRAFILLSIVSVGCICTQTNPFHVFCDYKKNRWTILASILGGIYLSCVFSFPFVYNKFNSIESLYFFHPRVSWILTPVIAAFLLKDKWNPLFGVLTIMGVLNSSRFLYYRAYLTDVGNRTAYYKTRTVFLSWTLYVFHYFPFLGLVLRRQEETHQR